MKFTRLLMKIILCVVGLTLFALFTIVNFYFLAIAAAFLFPGISDSSFSYIYALIFPPAISAFEVWLIRRNFKKKHSVSCTSSSESSVIWDVESEPVPEPEPSPLPPPSTSPVFSIPDDCSKYGGPEAELLNIDLMEGHAFEHWCAALLLRIGFHDVEVTPASGDDGVDIIAQKDGIRYAIQCKRYSSDLGNTPIQEVHAGKSVYNCHVGAVMTNRYFTAGGKRSAEATGTLLWDRDWIKSHL